MRKKLRLIGRLYFFIFVIWGLYRLIFRLPEEIEEIILKPVVWLGSTLFIVFKIEKRGISSLGYSLKRAGKSVEKGLVFGILFVLGGVSLGYLQGRSVDWGKLFSWDLLKLLGLGLITAVSEETVFRGYILNRLEEVLGKSFWPNLITSIGFALIHVPICVFVYHFGLPQIFLYLILVFLTSIGSGFIFSWTGAIWGSILVHLFLALPTFLAV